MIRRFEDKEPRLGLNVFVAEDALVLGEVTIGDESSIWYGTIIRGDVHSISIGSRTNIQDRCVVHVTTDTHPTRIGDRVTIGHGAILHGCTLGDRTLVGMGAIILDGVVVGEGSVIAAGALLPPGQTYSPGSLIVGAPGKVKRAVTAEELGWILQIADQYVTLSKRHSSSR
jgi:gamma-carbonic anhydrase